MSLDRPSGAARQGRHAFFENREGDVFVSPAMRDGKVVSKVLLNGKRLTQEHQLVHLERLILEDFAFRFSCPRQAAAQREEAKKKEAEKLKKKPAAKEKRQTDPQAS